MSLRLAVEAAMLLLAGTPPLMAGSLGISPTRVELTAQRPAETITVTNTGAEPVLVQVRTYAWLNGQEPERLEDTREILAMPPMAEIAPGKSQIVRIARRAAAGVTERAYRILVSEVPPETAAPGNGVRFSVRMNLPVFVTPEGAVPSPRWEASVVGGGLKLGLVNDGTAFLQIWRLVIAPDGAGDRLEIDQPAYLLAGERRDWSLADAADARRVHVTALTNIGTIELQVPVAGAPRS